MARNLFPGQIDEDDVRVLPHAVEDNLPAVRRHVKAPDGIARLQVGELAALPGIEIYYPEVLAEIIAEQRDNLPSARQKAVTIAASQYPQLGQGMWILLGRHRLDGVSCARRWRRIEDQPAVRRPDGQARKLVHEPNRSAPLDRCLEQPAAITLVSRHGDELSVRRPRGRVAYVQRRR